MIVTLLESLVSERERGENSRWVGSLVHNADPAAKGRLSASVMTRLSLSLCSVLSLGYSWRTWRYLVQKNFKSFVFMQCRADASRFHSPVAGGVPGEDREDMHSCGLDTSHAAVPKSRWNGWQSGRHKQAFRWLRDREAAAQWGRGRRCALPE